MKPAGLISTGVLFLLLGTLAPSYAQQDQHQQDNKGSKRDQKAKPEKQQQQARPTTRQPQQQAQGQQQARPTARQPQQQAQDQQQARPITRQQQQQAQGEQQARPTTRQPQQLAQDQQYQQGKEQQQQAKGRREQPRQHAERSAAEEQRQRAVPALRLSARGRGRIPDDRFRSNFGRGHEFRIENPRMVGGYSRFQYGGYWFGFVEPWPAGWYYTDDVYVDYIGDGYYLCNPSYPGARIAISVVL
jgi:hypothetical protein